MLRRENVSMFFHAPLLTFFSLNVSGWGQVNWLTCEQGGLLMVMEASWTCCIFDLVSVFVDLPPSSNLYRRHHQRWCSYKIQLCKKTDKFELQYTHRQLLTQHITKLHSMTRVSLVLTTITFKINSPGTQSALFFFRAATQVWTEVELPGAQLLAWE